MDQLVSTDTETELLMLKALENVSVISSPIKRLYKLDSGSYSNVYLGQLSNPNGSIQRVALKEGKSQKDNKVLLIEIKILAKLDHPNVIKLFGVQNDPLRLILEYMEWGNLEQVVQHRKYTDNDMLNALHNIASGMEYISKKKYIHRDLACKNVFVDSKKLCKIGDFGLSEYFGDTSDGPVKDKARIRIQPSLKQIYRNITKSDEWAYGVLIWQLYSLRDGTSYDYSEEKMDANNVPNTKIYPQPPTCPIDLFKYVKETLFNLDPQKRPDFTSIKEKIGAMLCSE